MLQFCILRGPRNPFRSLPQKVASTRFKGRSMDVATASGAPTGYVVSTRGRDKVFKHFWVLPDSYDSKLVRYKEAICRYCYKKSNAIFKVEVLSGIREVSVQDFLNSVKHPDPSCPFENDLMALDLPTRGSSTGIEGSNDNSATVDWDIEDVL